MGSSGLDAGTQAKLDQSLSHIRNRLLVFSGKGGVGKSTVAVNVAAGLALEGRKVGVLDADIHGPNVAKMLGVEQSRIEDAGDGRFKPVIAPGNIEVVSMAFFLDSPDSPVVWRGPLKMQAIRQFISDVAWGELDWLIIDSPPGTGDEPLSVVQLIPATAALVVTTPQSVALLDSRKAISFAQLLKLRIIGVVENMSGMVCPHCGVEVELFKKGGGERMAREMFVPFLGRIPLDPAIVGAGDDGRPFITEHPDSAAAKAMTEIVAKIVNSEAAK